ncbi:MAG: C39 family peptidase [Minisyncoccota bacterium]
MRGNSMGIIAASLLFAGIAGVAAVHAASIAPAAPSAGTLQAQLDAHTQQIAQLTQQIAQYQAELLKADANKKTLQDAIHVLDLQRKTVQAQVSATQNQISATQLRIRQLGSDIASTQETIAGNQAALASNMRNLEQVEEQPLIVQLISSSSLADTWADTDARLQVQSAVQDNVHSLEEQKSALASSQNASKQKQAVLTSQKDTLTSQQKSLTQTTKTKAQLLAETKAQEATYQRLLAAAKAELASFSTFSVNAGGSGLLTGQTSCDAWGCYYNQRDSAWGNMPLNGTQYHLKSDGCLVTSMAMVLTHYGHRSVTPVTINANPENFAAYYPAYLLYTIYVDGVSASRTTAAIDATLSTGSPVVVGLHAYGGTHYVVLTSGSRGNYLMRDPYIANAKDISFSAHYSLRNIFGISKVVIQ